MVAELRPLPLPICSYCTRRPEQIPEYIEAVELDWGVRQGMTPSQYVQEEEATYNPENGHFACTGCYIRIGMPSSSNGWRAP